jgi:hypothetical protein
MNIFAFYRSHLFVENVNRFMCIKDYNMNFIEDIVPYFNIQTFFEKFETSFENMGDYCTLTLRYYIKPKIDIINLLVSLDFVCDDICYYIDKYITEHLYLKFKIEFPENYPTLRIKWTLLDIDTSILFNSQDYGDMTFNEYYKYVVKNYNETYYLFVNITNDRFSFLNIENEIFLFVIYMHCINTAFIDYCFE